MSLGARIVAVTHSKVYLDFITHAPLAAAIVLGFRNIYALAFALTIGLWKNLLLDRYFQPDWNEAQAWQAVGFYGLGAGIGLGGWVLGT